MKSFLQNNLLDKSAKDFLVDCFVNDNIYDLCKNGIYKFNLLCLDYRNIDCELDIYFRNKMYDAKNIFSKHYKLDSCNAWEASHNDKLFDVSLLSINDVHELSYIAKYKIDTINKAFINTLRRDRFD